MIGWIGFALLMVGYILFNIKTTEKWFPPINALGSVLLTVEAYMIESWSLFAVNGFIVLMLLSKTIQQHWKK